MKERCLYMQEVEKEKILELWKQGFGSSRIAKTLGLNTNTVKTFCRRNGLTSDRTHIPTLKKDKEIEKSRCKNCGIFITQKPGAKKKLFCSDKCRMSWWNGHPELVERKTKHIVICQNCGKEFAVYGGRIRKFCSHNCYIEKRYGTGGSEL